MPHDRIPRRGRRLDPWRRPFDFVVGVGIGVGVLLLLARCGGSPEIAGGRVVLGGLDLDRLDPEVARLVEQKLEDVEARPDDAAARGELALALHANALYSEALKAYDEAIALAPRDPHWRYLSAVLAGVQLGDLSNALDRLDGALALDDSYVPAYLHRGTWLLGLGRADEALVSFERAARLAPGLPATREGLARVSLRLGNVDQAIGLLQPVVESQPDDAYAQALLGRALQRAGRLEEARIALARGVASQGARWPDPWLAAVTERQVSVGGLALRATTLLASERFQSVVELLTPPYERGVRAPDILDRLGFAHMALGHLDEALALFEEGLRSAPDDDALHFHVSIVHERLGHPEKALEHLARAMELNPQECRAPSRRGRILVQLRRPVEAVAAYEAAGRCDPKDPMPLVQVAMIQAGLNHPREALGAAEAAVERDPLSATAHHVLGSLRARNGEREVAIAELRRAVELDPSNRDAQALLQRVSGGGP